VLNPADLDIILARLDAEIAEQRRRDAIRALSRARTEAEVAAVARRFDLPHQGEGDAGVGKVLQ
jgi:hypothetical protein